MESSKVWEHPPRMGRIKRHFRDRNAAKTRRKATREIRKVSGHDADDYTALWARILKPLETYSGSLLETILDHTYAVIVVRDTEGRILWYNEKAAKVSGAPVKNRNPGRLTAEHLKKWPFLCLIPWEREAEIMNTKQPILNHIDSVEIDGKPHLIRTDKIPFRDETTGNIIGVTTFGIDLDESAEHMDRYERDVKYQLYRTDLKGSIHSPDE